MLNELKCIFTFPLSAANNKSEADNVYIALETKDPVSENTNLFSHKSNLLVIT